MEYIIFIDGSFEQNGNIATCAIIIYNNNILLEKILLYNINKMKTSTETELLSLKVALKHMSKKIKRDLVKKILIFTDCKSIVDVLSSSKKYKSYIKLNANLYNYVYNTNNLFEKEKNLNYRLEYLPRKFNIAHKFCHNLLKKCKKNSQNKKGMIQ